MQCQNAQSRPIVALWLRNHLYAASRVRTRVVGEHERARCSSVVPLHDRDEADAIKTEFAVQKLTKYPPNRTVLVWEPSAVLSAMQVPHSSDHTADGLKHAAAGAGSGRVESTAGYSESVGT